MALELQLTTDKARQGVDQINKSINTLEATFVKVSGTARTFETALQSLGNIRGINPSTVTNVQALAKALDRLGKVKALTDLATGLQALSNVNIGSVASNVQRLADALRGIRSPRGLASIATNLERIGNAATTAAGPVGRISAQLSTIRPTRGLTMIGRHLNNTTVSAGKLVNAFSSLRGSIATLTGLVGGFGISLGAVGIAQFLQSTYDVTRAFQAFQSQLTAATGDVKLAGVQLDFVRQVSTDLSLPILQLTKSYGRFASAVVGSGREVGDAQRLFTQFSSVFKVLNLDAGEISRGFLALSQIISKGKVSSEELGRQLGELFPAFQLLAKGMNITVAELFKLVSEGKVASDALFILGDQAAKTFGPGLENSLKTAQSAFNRFGNAITELFNQFGTGFFNALVPGINALAAAFSDPAFQTAVFQFAELAGVLSGGVLQAIALVAQNSRGLILALQVLIGLQIARTFLGWTQALITLGANARIAQAALKALPIAAASSQGVSALIAGIGIAARTAGVAILGFLTSFGGIALIAATVALILPTVIDYFYGTAESAASASQSTFDLKGILDGTAESGKSAADALNSTAESAEELSEGTTRAAKATDDYGNSIEKVSGNSAQLDAYLASNYDSVTRLESGFTQAAFGANTLDGALDGVEVSAYGAERGARSADNATRLLSDAFESSAASADIAANSYDDAANSARSFAEAAASAGSFLPDFSGGETDSGFGDTVFSGPGGSLFDEPSLFERTPDLVDFGNFSDLGADLFAGGGISNKGSGVSATVPASAFVGAPKLQTGIANTNSLLGPGGIPAILHPNEAVVPLTGGGAIPISGGGGAEDSLEVLREINLQSSRIWESVNMGTTLLIDEHNQTQALLAGINHNIVEAVKLLDSLRSPGSSGNGGGSGGGSGDPVSAGNRAINGITLSDAQQRFLDKQGFARFIREFGKQFGFTNDAGGGRSLGPGFFIDEDGKVKFGAGGGNGSAANGSFALGTPNASKDGFPVRVHPDEAIIPLPDGRSVPVSLPDSLNDRIDSILESPASRRSRVQSGGGSINIVMNITTPDAQSFRASQNQILQDMKARLDKATSTLGQTRQTEDPTRRPR